MVKVKEKKKKGGEIDNLYIILNLWLHLGRTRNSRLNYTPFVSKIL